MKGRAEKVGEVVQLLKKLIEAGIPTTDSGYFQTKKLMDAWILGDQDLIDEKIEFMRYGRVGHLSMFQDSKNPIFVLKATDALKEQIEG